MDPARVRAEIKVVGALGAEAHAELHAVIDGLADVQDRTQASLLAVRHGQGAWAAGLGPDQLLIMCAYTMMLSV